MLKYLLGTVAAVGLSSAASAADLYSAPPVIQEPGVVIAQDFNWTGFYVGVQGGYGWTNHEFDLDIDAPLSASESFDVDGDGWLAGINIGADWQFNSSWVVGIMADYNWSGIDGDGGTTLGTFGDLDGSVEQDNNWNILARAGYLVTPQTLVYALGGYSQADFDWSYSGTGTVGSDSGSETLDGWTVGVGSEMMLTENISAKAEYRYTAWDDMDFEFGGGGGPSGSGEVESDQHSILFGLNFRWDTTP